MNTETKRPFESAKIQIVELCFDVITTSPIRDPFPGEEDTFPEE